jgi:hypothetical protein
MGPCDCLGLGNVRVELRFRTRVLDWIEALGEIFDRRVCARVVG